MRVFYDRLVTDEDREKFIQILDDVTKKYFTLIFKTMIKFNSVIFKFQKKMNIKKFLTFFNSRKH